MDGLRVAVRDLARMPVDPHVIGHELAALIDADEARLLAQGQHGHAQAIAVRGRIGSAQLERDRLAVGRHRDRACRLLFGALADIAEPDQVGGRDEAPGGGRQIGGRHPIRTGRWCGHGRVPSAAE